MLTSGYYKLEKLVLVYIKRDGSAAVSSFDVN